MREERGKEEKGCGHMWVCVCIRESARGVVGPRDISLAPSGHGVGWCMWCYRFGFYTVLSHSDVVVLSNTTLGCCDTYSVVIFCVK